MGKKIIKSKQENNSNRFRSESEMLKEHAQSKDETIPQPSNELSNDVDNTYSIPAKENPHNLISSFENQPKVSFTQNSMLYPNKNSPISSPRNNTVNDSSVPALNNSPPFLLGPTAGNPPMLIPNNPHLIVPSPIVSGPSMITPNNPPMLNSNNPPPILSISTVNNSPMIDSNGFPLIMPNPAVNNFPVLGPNNLPPPLLSHGSSEQEDHIPNMRPVQDINSINRSISLSGEDSYSPSKDFYNNEKPSESSNILAMNQKEKKREFKLEREKEGHFRKKEDGKQSPKVKKVQMPFNLKKYVEEQKKEKRGEEVNPKKETNTNSIVQKLESKSTD